jgi:hypothetical protein
MNGEIRNKNRECELIHVAKSMIDGEIDLIEGVRKICFLRNYTKFPDSKIFIPIRAIDSETDHFPIGEMRKFCSMEYLRRMDEEMYVYISNMKGEILKCCSEIVRFLRSN